MFPKVSQAHARGEETIGLLKHTLLLALLVLGGGLLVTTLFPELLGKLLMKKGDLSGETFITLVQLIRYYAFAFVPVAATYILMFYYLGCHQKRFAFVIGAGMVAFLGLSHLLHPTIWHVLASMGGVSTVVLIVLLIKAKNIKPIKSKGI